MKDWARGKGANPPLWIQYYDYAQEFGCHPQDVPRVVSVRAWERWRMLRKAEASRTIRSAPRQGGHKETESERELKLWAMFEDRR